MSAWGTIENLVAWQHRALHHGAADGHALLRAGVHADGSMKVPAPDINMGVTTSFGLVKHRLEGSTEVRRPWRQ